MNQSTSSQAGFLSLGLIRLLLPLGLFWMVGQEIYAALTNRHPLSMNFAEYAQKRPAGKWVELKAAQLVLPAATWFGFLTAHSDIYIPLRAADSQPDAKVCALLVTHDPAMIALVEEMKAMADEKSALAFVIENHARLLPVRDVSGVLQFGINSESEKRRKIARLNDNLAADFVVIEDGKHPESILMLLWFFVATCFVTWLCWFCRFGKSAAAVAMQGPPCPATLSDVHGGSILIARSGGNDSVETAGGYDAAKKPNRCNSFTQRRDRKAIGIAIGTRK